MLKDRESEVADVILDGVMLGGDRWKILRLSIVHGHPAIPIHWIVVPGTGIPTEEKLEKILRDTAEFLRPRGKEVRFLADRGFGSGMTSCLLQEGGHRIAVRYGDAWRDARRICRKNLTRTAGI